MPGSLQIKVFGYKYPGKIRWRAAGTRRAGGEEQGESLFILQVANSLQRFRYSREALNPLAAKAFPAFSFRLT